MSETELKEITEKVTSELEPLLNFVRRLERKSREYALSGEALRDYYNRMNQVMDLIEFVTKDLQDYRGKLHSEGKLDPKKISKLTAKDNIYLLFVYFGVIESIGNVIVDIIVMLLIAQGKDFHIERAYGTPRIMHTTSLQELEKERVPLTTKLNFLRENGISGLVSIIDSEARNSIAHLRLRVKEDMVYIKGKPAPVLSYIGLRKLMRAFATTNKLLTKLVEDLFKKGE